MIRARMDSKNLNITLCLPVLTLTSIGKREANPTLKDFLVTYDVAQMGNAEFNPPPPAFLLVKAGLD